MQTSSTLVGCIPEAHSNLLRQPVRASLCTDKPYALVASVQLASCSKQYILYNLLHT